jgi:hypothetical protein
VEIERFANFDAVDFGQYLRTRFPHLEETTSEEGTSWGDGPTAESLPSKCKGVNGLKAGNGAPSPSETIDIEEEQTPVKMKN